MRTVATTEDLVEAGLELQEELQAEPKTTDLGEGRPSWGLIYKHFGSIGSFRDAIHMEESDETRIATLIKTGRELMANLEREVAPSDLQDSSQHLSFENINSLFGSWEAFHFRLNPQFPQVNIQKDLISLDDLLLAVNQRLPNSAKPVKEADIRRWSIQGNKQMIPLARMAGRVGLFSKTIIPLLVKIRELTESGLSLKEVRSLMVIFGKYQKLTKAACSECSKVLNAYLTNSQTITCSDCSKK